MKIKMTMLAAAILAGGCAGIRTSSPEGQPLLMNEAEFAAYVEHVFRHHNAVVNDLLFATNSLGEPNVAEDIALLRAEARMDHACRSLNDAASAAATGNSPDIWTKMSLADAVPECEAATRKVEKLISQGARGTSEDSSP
jgi:hypothetical protein